MAALAAGASDRRQAGGFGLQYRRAWLRLRAIDYGNCAVKQGSRNLHDLRGMSFRRHSTGFGPLRRAGSRAFVAFGWRAGRVRSVRGLVNSVMLTARLRSGGACHKVVSHHGFGDGWAASRGDAPGGVGFGWRFQRVSVSIEKRGGSHEVSSSGCTGKTGWNKR